MAELYIVSKKLIAMMPGTFDRIEAHDPEDPESSDLLWIAGAEQSVLCDGEYIAVSPLTEDSDSWYVSHDSADKVGGHPTLWNMSGDEPEILRGIKQHLEANIE